MAYVYYRTDKGTVQDYRITTQEGHKMVPFDKTKIVDKPYYFVQSQFLGGNTNALPGGLSMRAGGTYSNEYSPAPDMSISVRDSTNTYFSSDGNKAYARAYAKFKSKCYTSADTLTALVERRKTAEMIGLRLVQLHKGARHLKRGNFREFLKTFGIKPLNKHQNKTWSRPKEFGALWLEYWMGWAPTIGDINNAVDSLTSPIPEIPIRAGSRVDKSLNTSKTQWGSTFKQDWSGNCTVWIQASLKVENPLLFMASSVGLLNPVATAWKTTPFSWFYDWFSNIAQVLEQYTDWVGLQLVDLNISCKTKMSGSWVVTNARGAFNVTPPPPEPLYRVREITFFTRRTGGVMPLIRPKLVLPNGLSITRGATAVSLLITMFTPEKAAKHKP